MRRASPGCDCGGSCTWARTAPRGGGCVLGRPEGGASHRAALRRPAGGPPGEGSGTLRRGGGRRTRRPRRPGGTLAGRRNGLVEEAIDLLRRPLLQGRHLLGAQPAVGGRRVDAPVGVV